MCKSPGQKTYRRWTGPVAWNGKQLQSTEDWVFTLDDSDLSLLHKCVAKSLACDVPLEQQDHRDVELGQLEDRLVALRATLLDGYGFALIRGLSKTGWCDLELIHAYWLIGSVFGDAVSQNARADLLGHVIDKRQDPSAARIYQTSRAQPFHSDSCDIVGLLCLRQARAGGESAIASSATVHNELRDQNPAALDLLYGEFQCDRYGEIPEGKSPHYPVRIFNTVAGRLVCCGMDPDIRSAQRLQEVPSLTRAQTDALDAFQSTAKEVALNMMLERGDIQMVNNHVVVHAREQFIDFEDPERRRYLVRLWLSSPFGRTLPEFLRERWGNIKPGSKRGGILVPGANPTVNFEP